MPRTSEKGKNNPYYLARMVASKSNDRLSSRAGASEVLGISEKRITWIENNLTNPYPEEVVIMASLYNAPTLENLYCSTVCPLKGLPVIENKTLSEIAISAYQSLRYAREMQEEIIDIVEDGKITSDEVVRVKRIIGLLDEMTKVKEELSIKLKVLNVDWRKENCYAEKAARR